MSLIGGKRAVMTLFSGPLDMLSHRVRIVLAEKGVTVDIIDTDVNNPPADLIDVNPYQNIPTLVDRDLSLYHPNVIMEYLDERFPHPPLLPVYPVARGRSRLMIYRIDRDWCTLADKINSTTGKAQEKIREELADSLMTVASVIKQMPWFFSEEFSLVDCALAPLLWRLPSLGVKLPKQGKDIELYAKRIFERDAFQSSLSAAEKDLPKWD